MKDQTDAQLLRAYAEHRSDPAFAELVRRHVDIVYSAALRMVCDAHLAQDVTQGVFLALARNAARLTDRAVLSGWLHRTAQNIAAQTVRTDVRRRSREQEAAAMNELLAAEPNAVWEHIAPLLDTALGELSDADRDALLLRYFERKSANEMAATLGISDEAAQKRVNRAVERLRGLFANRGITVGASGLVVVITANAVHAAPPGLVVTISSVATLAATTLMTTATNAVTMTTMQKLVVATILVASLGTPVLVQVHAQKQLAEQVRALQRQADLLAELKARNEKLTNLLTETKSSSAVHGDQFMELLRLRGQVGRLSREVQALKQLNASSSTNAGNNFATTSRIWSERATQLRQWLEANPAGRIPELQFLTEQEWIESIHPLALSTDEEYRRAVSNLRANAESRVLDVLQGALWQFGLSNAGRFPSELTQLKPYLGSSLDDAILNRYEIVRTKDLVGELQLGEDWAITQKVPVDDVWDARLTIGMTGGGMADSRVTNRWRQRHGQGNE